MTHQNADDVAIARLDYQPPFADLADLDPSPVLVPVAELSMPQRIDAYLCGADAATLSLNYTLSRGRAYRKSGRRSATWFLYRATGRGYDLARSFQAETLAAAVALANEWMADEALLDEPRRAA